MNWYFAAMVAAPLCSIVGYVLGRLSVGGSAKTDPVGGRAKPQGEPPKPGTLTGSFVGTEQPSSHSGEGK